MSSREAIDKNKILDNILSSLNLIQKNLYLFVTTSDKSLVFPKKESFVRDEELHKRKIELDKKDFIATAEELFSEGNSIESVELKHFSGHSPIILYEEDEEAFKPVSADHFINFVWKQLEKFINDKELNRKSGHLV